MMVGVNPEDEEERILAPVKCNLAPPPVSLKYRIIGSDNGSSSIEWLGESTITANDVLQPNDDDKSHKKIDQAKDFLLDILEGEAVLADTVKQSAKDQGITPRTLRRAKKMMQVRSVKEEFQGKSAWELPDCMKVWADDD